MSDSFSLSLTEARQAIHACLDAGDVPLIMGDPGIGKTSIMRAVASERGVPCVDLIVSQIPQEEITGISVADLATRLVERLPLARIRAVRDEPAILFFDELPNAHQSQQGVILQTFLDRVCGDVALHPATRLAAAGNPPRTGAGANRLAAPLVGRVCTIQVAPTVGEVCAYFRDRLGREPGPLGTLAIDLAETAETDPSLVEVTTPADVTKPYGAPRSWEWGLRSLAAHVTRGGSPDDLIGGAILAGRVGEARAVAWRAILALRGKLPTLQEIVSDPVSARLPPDASATIASVGLLALAVRVDAGAAWTYAGRLDAEYQTIARQGLLRGPPIEQGPVKWRAQAVRARTQIQALASREIREAHAA